MGLDSKLFCGGDNNIHEALTVSVPKSPSVGFARELPGQPLGGRMPRYLAPQ
jgi:hypothetical protein